MGSTSSTRMTSNKPSRLGGASSLLLLSIVFHGVYLLSIFDIYFKSPVTKGVELRYGVGNGLDEGTKKNVVGEGLAKRVVLIVGDGLRADKNFQTYPNPPFPQQDPLPSSIPPTAHALVSFNRTTPAPYLRNLIATGQAEWGISHTRVPTESRPGHVALIAGMYEDVSAVTRGWQTNPVVFDSVFNQSAHTFSFGSPDILPMFQRGALAGKVSAWSYAEQFEDFSTDAVHLDLWVLDQLNTLLRNASSQPALDTQLRQSGNVFFLHLLGLDTTGHSYRPHGAEYHRNIRVVDHVVKQTERILSDFFGNDGETAFVFTADHGMSSKGNHGDGEPDNTRTPLIVWGKGVAANGPRDSSTPHDEYSGEWGLPSTRKDVEQADIAPLMSILGGLPIPANSAGRIPLNFLNASPEFKARAAFANAQQILAEFVVKSDSKEKTALRFRAFPGLIDSAEKGTLSVASHKAKILHDIGHGEYDRAITASMQLVQIGLEGLTYFQTYDWLQLRIIVTLGYIGSMAYSTHYILRTHVYSRPSQPTRTASLTSPILFSILFTVLCIKFVLERSPVTYYVYLAFPCLFWAKILREPWPFTQLFDRIRASWGTIFVIFVTLESIVYGYMDRRIFFALLCAMGAIWPRFGFEPKFKKKHKNLLLGWTANCFLTAIFPLLPVETGKENLFIIMSGGVCFFVLGATAWLNFKPKMADKQTKFSPVFASTRIWIWIQLILIACMMIVTWISATNLQQKKGLPVTSQLAGWIVLLTSLLVPVLQGRPENQPAFERIFVVLFALGPAFIILSRSYEALFLATFCANLYIWVTLERALAASLAGSKQAENRLNGNHLRISLFFLIFLNVAFFGVGNVASISSFYLEPVFRLIPIFAPFPMALLLLFKLLSPFLALSTFSAFLTHALNLPAFSLFIIASTLADVLTLNFFFLVSDKGSWLEIGSTITNFAICSLLGIFNSVLYLAGEWILAGASIDSDAHKVD